MSPDVLSAISPAVQSDILEQVESFDNCLYLEREPEAREARDLASLDLNGCKSGLGNNAKEHRCRRPHHDIVPLTTANHRFKYDGAPA